jgi:hypothetical protein
LQASPISHKETGVQVYNYFVDRDIYQQELKRILFSFETDIPKLVLVKALEEAVNV